jgi:hypothetical protein
MLFRRAPLLYFIVGPIHQQTFDPIKSDEFDLISWISFKVQFMHGGGPLHCVFGACAEFLSSVSRDGGTYDLVTSRATGHITTFRHCDKVGYRGGGVAAETEGARLARPKLAIARCIKGSITPEGRYLIIEEFRVRAGLR